MHLTGVSLPTNCLDVRYRHLHLVEVRIDHDRYLDTLSYYPFSLHTEDTRYFQIERRENYSEPNLNIITR